MTVAEQLHKKPDLDEWARRVKALLAAELEAAKRPRPLVVSPQVYERLRREWQGKEARR